MHTSSSAAACFFAVGLIGFLSTASSGQLLYEDAKLSASDGDAEDEFGISVDLDDGLTAIGAWKHDIGGASSTGAVYVFDSKTGTQVQKLFVDDAEEGDLVGYRIAIDNGIVLAGSHGDDENGETAGAAYLFNSSTGAPYKKLLAPDGATGDRFGWSVALGDNLAVVGAHWDDDLGNQSGSAYVFDAMSGTMLFKLLPSAGDDIDWFGETVAIGDGVIAVSARRDDDLGLNSGAVYLFDASTGVQFAKLAPNELEEDDQFGWDIAIDDGVLAVAAHHDDDNWFQSGAVYLFDVNSGTLLRKITQHTGFAEFFGRQVALHDGVLAVSAIYYPVKGPGFGSIYLFDISTGNQLSQLASSGGEQLDSFGSSLDIFEGTVAVGAPWDDDNGSESGSVYVFELGSFECLADLNGDGALDFLDINAFLSAYQNGCP